MTTFSIHVTFSSTYATPYDATVYTSEKTQRNPETGEIERYSTVGDIGGILLENLNANRFMELQGRRNATVKNILGVYDFTRAEIQNKTINPIVRVGGDFYLYAITMDKYSLSLNQRLIELYIVSSIKDALLDSIFELPEDIVSGMTALIGKLKKEMRPYTRDFEFEFRVTGREIILDFANKLNSDYRKIVFNISYP